MIDVQTATLIHRPRNVVASFAADPANAPRWYRNIESAEWKTTGPLAVGSRVAFVAHFLGRKLSYVYEIVEYVPEEKLVMRTFEGPFPMETTYRWTAVADSTRMTLSNRGEPTGFSRLVAPLVATMMRSANRKDLTAIKKLLEGTEWR